MREIGTLSRLLPVQLLLGVRWLDAGVERGHAYEYRITALAESGDNRPAVTTPTVVFPGIAEVAPLQVAETEGETVLTRVLWRAGSGTAPSTFRVYRREGITGAFTEMFPNSGDSCCNVTMTLLRRSDTTLCLLLDKTVSAGTVYQYYAVARDYFHNEGPVSDTATVMTFQMRQVPLPEHLKALSVDTAGIELRWRLREASAVHGIVIERGPAIDTGFVELFTAAPSDTSFLDVTVDPMERYYYRLRLIGPGGLRSIPSAVVIGIFKSSLPPPPPNGVFAEAIERGVRVGWWPDTASHIAGYYVYRAEGYGVPLKQVSAMLPARDGAYVDTSSALLGDRTYMYAVQAVNTSHRVSALSDTVGAIPDIPVPVEAPMDLQAAIDGQVVRLSGNTSIARHKDILGFRVLRRTARDKRFVPVADTMLYAWQNFHSEAAPAPGQRVAYAVRAYSVKGDSSELSATVTVAADARRYYPPGNLRAMKDGKSVLLEWDDIVQQDVAALHVYRYERGKKAVLVAKVKADSREYVDKKPGRAEFVSYYMTVAGSSGTESARSRVVSVRLK